ncbi:MAG: protein-glutamate O-methyltransferase CheR [Peptococcaceae bacterium]|nr:protein-glutamate O-methyltransferase CheR [Peptococcaceae bacterium]
MSSQDPAYAQFRTELAKTQGLDLSVYKETQLFRRLNSYMQRHQIGGFGDLTNYIHSHEKASHLIDYLDINVSEFFRNPELFSYLEQEVLPTFATKQKRVSVWSAGCSIGAEPYSLTMAILETRPALVAAIVATDLDAAALRQAATGRYSQADVRNVAPERITRYFDVTPGGVEVKKNAKSMVSFRRHDLLKDPIESGFDLIVCRNVAIYFTEGAKLLMLRRFATALATGGYLFTGATESYPNHREFGLKRVHTCFYQKVGD